MKKLTAWGIPLLMTTLLFSCKKEESTQQNSITGNYKFISMAASTTAIMEANSGTDVEKSVTLSQYLTKNNTGTIQITSSSMNSNNIAYSIDTVAKAYMYLNGVLTDTMEMPFQYTAVPVSSSAPYKMIGTDSIYFSSGTMFSDGTAQQTIPGGAKLRIEGDKLYMSVHAKQNSTQIIQGQSVSTSQEMQSVITLQKM